MLQLSLCFSGKLFPCLTRFLNFFVSFGTPFLASAIHTVRMAMDHEADGGTSSWLHLSSGKSEPHWTVKEPRSLSVNRRVARHVCNVLQQVGEAHAKHQHPWTNMMFFNGYVLQPANHRLTIQPSSNIWNRWLTIFEMAKLTTKKITSDNYQPTSINQVFFTVGLIEPCLALTCR